MGDRVLILFLMFLVIKSNHLERLPTMPANLDQSQPHKFFCRSYPRGARLIALGSPDKKAAIPASWFP